MCATRWIQRYDAINYFSELFTFVIKALNIISEWKDPADACMLKNFIENTEFLISLYIVKVLINIAMIFISFIWRITYTY